MNFRCSRSSLDNYILLYYRRLAIKVYLHKRTFNIELSVLFLCLQIGGVKMEGTVTLEIQEYNELYVKAVQGQELERENAELRKRLDNTVTMGDKYIGPIDGSKLRSDTNKVTLDATEYERLCKENKELKNMNENLSICMSTEMLKKRRKMLEELEKTSETSVTYERAKGLKLRGRRHYAKGGVTTKEEVTELKRSKKNK